MSQSTHAAPPANEPGASGVEPRTGAELLVDSLAAAGVRTLFGVPGDTGVDLYHALARQQRVRHVMARDERHAATMADAYARCSNTIGAVEVSSGGGATFSIGGLGEPFAASVPMLVISSDIHTSSRGTGALTEIDQEQLFAAVTKWRRRITTAADIPSTIAQAVLEATSGRPAPVAIVVPEDVLGQLATAATQPVTSTVPRSRPVPELSQLIQLARDLQSAERPAIVAGSGVHISGAWEELEGLAECAGVPVATTIQGKGAYSETGQWSLGVVGANGGRDYVNRYVAMADVVLLVGTRANATDTNSFQSPPRSGPRIYQLDIDPTGPRNFKDSINLTGDAKATLSKLSRLLSGEPRTARDEVANELAERRQSWRNQHHTHASQDIGGRLSARAVLHTLRQSVPNDAIIVADCGTPTPLLAADWETQRAERAIIVARGHGPMGYAIPAAVGAAFAHPHRRIICVTTDGSLTMACGELATVVQHELPITFVQLTNGAFGWIKMLQHLYFERSYFGVDLHPVDAVGVAHAFGLAAQRVGSLTQLGSNLQVSDGPMYLDVPVPEQLQEVPPVAPWQEALLGEGSRPVY